MQKHFLELLKGLRVKLTLILLFSAILSYPQETLTPKSINYEDSTFCWNLKQSRAIAKHIEKSKHCDSIFVLYDSVNYRLSNIIIQKKDTIQELKIDKLRLKEEIKTEQRKVQNYKKYGKWGLLVSFFLGIVTSIAI